MIGDIDKRNGSSSSTSGARPASSPTLRTVLTALGGSLLSSLCAPHGLDVPVSVPVIYDRAEALREQADGILLLVGSEAAAPATLDAIRTAARSGYAAVVAKLRNDEPRPLVESSHDNGIAALACADELPWRRLDALLSAAIGVGTGASSSLQAGDMFALANAIAGVLGGAVAIEDAARNVVAYSTLPSQRIDDVRSQGILARRIPDLPKHDQQYREVFAAPSVLHYPFDASTDELPRAAIPVRAGAEVLGSIWVIEEHPPLVADATRVLEDAAKMAALYFLRTRTATDLERQARAEMLRGLLEGRAMTPSLAESLGLRPAQPFVVVGFSSTSFDEGGSIPFVPHLGTEVDRYISAFHPDDSSVAIGSTVYALIPSLADEGSALRFAREAALHTESVLGHPVRAAAQIGTDPVKAPDVRDEVDETLHVLAVDPTAPRVATAKQASNRILLSRLHNALQRYPTMLHPSVESLCVHDRERGTAYRKTLLAYLEAMGDVAAAARRIQVHPNTLRYRLRRAQAVFGIDLDAPDERLLLWLQLRVLVDRVEQTGGWPSSSVVRRAAN